MENLIELIGKYKVSLGTIIALISVLYGAWSYADSYFARASDITVITKQISDMKKSALDDKVFELQLKKETMPKAFSPLDNALLDRYKQKLKEIIESR